MKDPVPFDRFGPVEYPESDGEPVGETDLHIEELFALRSTLKEHFRERDDVYVAGNLLVYYEEGDPRRRFAPDVFVANGVKPRHRRTYKLWEEGCPPAVVLEVSSKGTWLEDTGNKKALCARLGVEEYFLFDPEGDYLDPRLQGFRLSGSEYTRAPTGPDGEVRSELLGLTFRVEDVHLRCVDSATGQLLRRPEELADALRKAEAELARLKKGGS